MNKATLLIVGILLGFDKDHEIFDGVDWDSEVADELLHAQKIKKEDIFTMAPNGKSFFEYGQTWKNLKKLFNFMKDNDDPISIEDLKRIVVNNKTAIELAVECESLEDLFVPEIWAGHSDEMENLCYTIQKRHRKGIDFEKIKSAVASLEGRVTREDQLRQMGTSSTEMISALKSGYHDRIKERLAKNGDHLRLADAQLCDEDGDHALYSLTAWNKFDELYDEWDKHDEIPDAEFFLFKRGKQDSIVESAFSHSKQDKIFNDRVFAGRPDELMKLYDALSDAYKRRLDIEKIRDNIIEQICEDMIVLDSSLSLSDLTTPLYGTEDESTSPIIGLGLRKTWMNMDDVVNVLRTKEQQITLADLRADSGLNGESCFLRAALFGKFDLVLDILEANHERFEISDLLAKNKDDESVLTALIEKDQLGSLLKPELWIGRVRDLGALWENIPDSVRQKIKEAFHQTQTQANLMSLQMLGEPESTEKPPSIEP